MDKYCIHYDCKTCNNRGFLKEGYLCKYENIIEAWKQEFEAKGFGSGDGHLVWDFIKDLERASYRAQPSTSEPPKESVSCLICGFGKPKKQVEGFYCSYYEKTDPAFHPAFFRTDQGLSAEGDEPCKYYKPTSEPPIEAGWISVKDRIPEMKGGIGISNDVLCFKVCDGECGLKYHMWIALFVESGKVSPSPFGPPTHWMELPEAPIEEPS